MLGVNSAGVRLSILGVATVLLIACSSELPRPRLAAHSTADLAMVPFPPPPARVEFVPPMPHDDAVWIDGQWRWTGREWAWIYGAWVLPPPGAGYSPWTAVRNREGVLFHAPGAWRDSSGRILREPAILARGRASDESVIEDEGILEDTGPNIPPNKAAPITPKKGSRRPRDQVAGEPGIALGVDLP